MSARSTTARIARRAASGGSGRAHSRLRGSRGRRQAGVMAVPDLRSRPLGPDGRQGDAGEQHPTCHSKRPREYLRAGIAEGGDSGIPRGIGLTECFGHASRPSPSSSVIPGCRVRVRSMWRRAAGGHPHADCGSERPLLEANQQSLDKGEVVRSDGPSDDADRAGGCSNQMPGVRTESGPRHCPTPRTSLPPSADRPSSSFEHGGVELGSVAT